MVVLPCSCGCTDVALVPVLAPVPVSPFSSRRRAAVIVRCALHCAHVPFGIIQHAGYYYDHDHDHAFIYITIVQPCRARSAKPVVAKLATSLGHAARRLVLLPPRLAYCILNMDIASASCTMHNKHAYAHAFIFFCPCLLYRHAARCSCSSSQYQPTKRPQPVTREESRSLWLKNNQ